MPFPPVPLMDALTNGCTSFHGAVRNVTGVKPAPANYWPPRKGLTGAVVQKELRGRGAGLALGVSQGWDHPMPEASCMYRRLSETLLMF